MTTPTTTSTPAAAKERGPTWLPYLIDFGPLLVFFLTYKFGAPAAEKYALTTAAIRATGAFMVAIMAAVAVSKWKLGRVSPMLWMSAGLVIVFGALTVYLRDARFIMLKPTIIYVLLGAALLIGWLRGKPLLKYLLQAAYDGLTHEGWLKLSRNWGLFFLVLALVNEVARRELSFDHWLTLKVWGVTALTFAFALAQTPLLLRHGLKIQIDGDDGAST